MEPRVLNILICGSNEASLHRMARLLNDEGVTIQISSRLVDCLGFIPRNWDYLIIDLDNINSFLRSLLHAFFRKYPDVCRIGVSAKSDSAEEAVKLSCGLELDAYMSEMPRVEALIVLFPEVAAHYLCDDEILSKLDLPPDKVATDYESVEPKREVSTPPLRLKMGYKEVPLAL